MALFYDSVRVGAVQLHPFFRNLESAPELIPTRYVTGVVVIERLVFVCSFLLVSIASKGQQCTLPSRIFLPTADETRYEGFGEVIAVDEQYMVTGSPDNSSLQAHAGIASVYKLNTENKWTKIADLTPSDPGKHRGFGSRVAISGNSIVIFGREYNDAGIMRGKLYVYEKSDGEEWLSSTEDYVIAKEFGAPLIQNSFGPFEVHGDELTTIGSDGGKAQIEIYKKSGGIFSLSQSLDLPKSNSGYSYFAWNLAVGQNFIVIGSEQFENEDRSNGAAFVYEKNGLYGTTPVRLKSTQQSASQWRAFGYAIAANGNTIVVQGLRNDGNIYNQTFYVFERPAGGWIDAEQSPILESPGYVVSYSQLVVSDSYFFSIGAGYESIVGFKKGAGGWSSNATRFTIDKLPSDKALFAYQIQLNDNHLVVGCPSRHLTTGITEELVADYYVPTGAWETPGLMYHQLIYSSSINATDDFFGEVFGVYNNHLAIAAPGDDQGGFGAGVIYIFDALKQSSVPEQKIYSPDNENYTGFGNSLAMGDSLMFIGAPYKDSISSDGTKTYSMGKVYVYRLGASGWSYSSQIIPPKIHSEVTFGRQIAWSRGYCAVTEFYSGSSESVGRVHIYKENVSTGKFEYIATLDPATHLRSDFFGKSMVMTDSMMVIGTGNFAPNSSYRMSVYIFKKKGEWKNATEDARLRSTDSGWSDRFGASVSMYGEYIVVGAPYSPGFDPRPIPRNYVIPGAAYIYKRPIGGWKGTLTETAKLTPSDPTEFGAYGLSVVIDHDDIFIGSPNVYQQYNHTDKFTNYDKTLIPGKVYHYKKPPGGWSTTSQESRQLHSFEPEIVDGYGATIFVSERFLYVGAMLDDTESGFRTGSVQTMMQLPAIDAPEVLCVDQAPIKLLGFPKAGQWSGPGINSTTGAFSPAVAGAGIHTITYSYGGCETTTYINVLPSQMVVRNQSNAVQTKCIGESILIAFESNEHPGNYFWYFKETFDGLYSKYDSAKQVIIASKPGYYEVIVHRGLCPTRKASFRITDEDKVSIKIEPVPVVCANSEIQLAVSPASGHWTGDGISSDGKFSPFNLEDGSYKEVYKVVTPAGCVWKDSVIVKVDILKQPVIVYNGQPICGNDKVKLSLTNVDNRSKIEWYNGGKLLSGLSGTTIQTSEGGGYTAVVSKGTCRLETAIQVVQKEATEIKFDIPVICSDDVVALTVSPPNGIWKGEGITPDGNFDPAGLVDGNYSEHYTVVTSLGCTLRKSVDVRVDKLKVPVLTTDLKEVCINQPATLNLNYVDDRTAITWYHNGNEAPGQNKPTLTAGEAGTYSATVVKSVCSASAIPVELAALSDSLFVPNVFTPNYDAVNDNFEVKLNGIDNFHLLLFNRYGQTMFETSDPAFKWHGESVPSGVYFWRIAYTTCSNVGKEKKGWVHVLK
jgi:gliding motility-associated-like protein